MIHNDQITLLLLRQYDLPSRYRDVKALNRTVIAHTPFKSKIQSDQTIPQMQHSFKGNNVLYLMNNPHRQPYEPYNMAGQPHPVIPNDTVLTPRVIQTTIILSVLDFALLLSQIYCIVHIFTYSLSHDYYKADLFFYLYFFASLSLTLLTYFTRLLSCLVFSCFPRQNKRQKLILLVSVLTPSIKYYLFRRVADQHVKMLTIYRWDVAGVVYFIVSGICCLLTYNVTYIDEQMSTRDVVYLFLALAVLSSSAMQGIVIFIHKSWTERQIMIQKYGVNGAAMPYYEDNQDAASYHGVD